MSKKSLITISGITIIVIPFLGLPYTISTPIFVVVGLLIIFIARVGVKKKIISKPTE